MSQYKAYSAYKDSGIKWIEQVPEHWSVAQIKRISTLNPKKSSLTKERDALCSFLPMEKLRTNAVTLDETRTIEEVYDGYSYFCDRDILIAKVTPCFENRNIAVAEGLVNGVGFGSTEINVIRTNEKGHNRFLYYRLQEEQFRKIAISEMRGTGGLKRVPTEMFESFSIGLPDIEEQAFIAAILDRETARIEALIQKKNRFVDLLKEKVIAIAMAEQIHGDGQLIRLRYLTQIISRPVTIADGDEYVALGLYNRGRGLFHKPPTLGKDIGESDFFYVEEGDLILSGQFAWEGAVTMASSNENGCVVSHRYPVVRGKTVATEYLLALLMTNFGDFLLNESSRGAAGRNRPLNINLLLNEKVRMPSAKAQKNVKRLVELKAKLEKKVQESIDLLKERRAAFITAAVTGQIDLRGKQ